jgi:hypothetical protein
MRWLPLLESKAHVPILPRPTGVPTASEALNCQAECGVSRWSFEGKHFVDFEHVGTRSGKLGRSEGLTKLILHVFALLRRAGDRPLHDLASRPSIMMIEPTLEGAECRCGSKTY